MASIAYDWGWFAYNANDDLQAVFTTRGCCLGPPFETLDYVPGWNFLSMVMVFIIIIIINDHLFIYLLLLNGHAFPATSNE